MKKQLVDVTSTGCQAKVKECSPAAAMTRPAMLCSQRLHSWSAALFATIEFSKASRVHGHCPLHRSWPSITNSSVMRTGSLKTRGDSVPGTAARNEPDVVLQM